MEDLDSQKALNPRMRGRTDTRVSSWSVKDKQSRRPTALRNEGSADAVRDVNMKEETSDQTKLNQTLTYYEGLKLLLHDDDKV